MKKTALILSLLLIFALTGCGDKPFKSDDQDYTFAEVDTISYLYNNGTTESVLYEYTFDNEFKVFLNEDQTIINFRNINNYQTVSDEIQALFDFYGKRVAITKVASTNYRQKQKLSLGATENDYNYETVEVDEVAFNANAFISVDNGVTLLVSYTEFTIGDESILVPSYIQLFTHEIHRELSWTFLGSDNDYTDTPGIVVNYETIVVPMPMKTGSDKPFEDGQVNDPVMIDNFNRFKESTIATDDNAGDIWTLCTDTVVDNCIQENYTVLNVQIYEMKIDDVYDFYTDYYSGGHDGYDFVFVNSGYTFTITDIEEVQVRLENDQIVDVVNAIIRIYE